MPRNAIDRDLPGWQGGRFGNSTCEHVAPTTLTCWGCDCHNGTEPCEIGQSCLWFSQGCSIGCATCDGGESNPNTEDRCGSGMKPTNNDPRFRTYNRNVEAMSEADLFQHNPWRAPGNAPVYGPCGMAGGGPKYEMTQLSYVDTQFAKQGHLGHLLPRSPTGVSWASGSTVEVKWSIRANHGGGYQYRLCPASAALTEECFQKMPLDFAKKTWLEFRNGSRLEIESKYLSAGTMPANSTWAMNPLPFCDERQDMCTAHGIEQEGSFQPPCHGDDPRENSTDPRPHPLCSGAFPFGVTIVDQLRVPENLEAGEYVLGLRYDCEITAQVWAQCSDITIVDAIV